MPRTLSRPGRGAIVNAALALASLLATCAACELVAAKLLLMRTPLDRQEFLSDGLRVLAQSSKQGIVPRPGFILLEGDSYAAGAGDWLLQADARANPPFHSAHVLHAMTGRDVISFGMPGAGSVGGFVLAPRRLKGCLERLALFDVPEPGLVLLYFYEGNDLDDNLREAASFGRSVEGLTAVEHPCGPLDNLVFGSLLGLARHAQRPPPRSALERPAANTDHGEATPNVALIDGARVVLPLHLQSPALDLGEDQIDLALGILEQSVRASRRLFPRAAFALVYVPSPLSSYALVSERVDAQRYEESGAREYPRRSVSERSDAIATRVAGLCATNGLGFIDARPAIRSVAEHTLVHGPRDWKHFNQKGYEALARAIAAAPRVVR